MNFHQQMANVERNTDKSKLVEELALSVIPGYLGWKVGKAMYNLGRESSEEETDNSFDRTMHAGGSLLIGGLFGGGLEVAALHAASNAMNSTTLVDFLGGVGMYVLTHVCAGGMYYCFEDSRKAIIKSRAGEAKRGCEDES